jgi:hypothetical protein
LSIASKSAPSSELGRRGLRPGQKAYLWTRDLHLYLGLFISPFVLVYALSAIALNHAVLPWGGRDGRVAAEQTVNVGPQAGEDSVQLAKDLRRELGLQGEIGFVNRDEAKQTLAFPIERPGELRKVEVDLATGRTRIETRRTGVWDAVIYLHKKPGPHNVKLRGNWGPMRAWAWLADASVYALMLSSLTGIYLWAILRAERKVGLLFLGGGVVTFSLAVVALAGLVS